MLTSVTSLLSTACVFLAATGSALPVAENANIQPVSYASHQVLSFDVTTDQQKQVIDGLVANTTLHLDVWSMVRQGRVDIRIPPESLDFVVHQTEGVIPRSVFIPDVQQAIAEANAEIAAAGDFHAAYHTYDEIVAFLNDLTSRYAQRAQRISLPVKTFEGRTIEGISIGGGSQKPVVFFHGAIHAREWISAATMLYFADQFLTAYDTDATIKKLADAFEIVIVPVANVDGYVYTHTKDRMWRKNRQPGSSCVGTDPNRNFGYQWGTGGSSSDECADDYKGPQAFSSPEAMSVSQYITDRKPLVYADFHSYSQLLMTPFGYSCSNYPSNSDDLTAIASGAGNAIAQLARTRYRTGPICETIYQASGSSIDWAQVTGGVKYPFAVELRDTGRYGFLLPASQIVPTGKETLAGFQYVLKEVLTRESAPSAQSS